VYLDHVPARRRQGDRFGGRRLSPQRRCLECIKFPNIFGAGANQIPLASTICSATLTLTIPSDTGDDPVVYQVTESWVEAEVTWNNRSAGQAWTNAGANGTGSHKTTAEGSLPAGSSGAQNVTVTTSVQNWSDGEVNEGWALIASGSGGVTFNTSENATQSTRPKLTVTYSPQPPTVTSVSPNNGPTAGGTAVTITGTNFVSGATVTFGGIAATGVTFVSSTQIDATTPAHAAGAVDVSVTNPDTQSGTLSNAYTYIDPAPTVTSVAPTSGPDTGGTVVTITGTNFVLGATVTFGGTAVTDMIFVSSTQIDVTTPAHAAGAVDVTVTNPDTQSGTLSNGYTYIAPPPTVTNVAPNSGPTGGGTVVTITGTNFVSGATVTFGGTAATGVTFVSSTTITVTTPAHAPGAVDVVVTNPDTQSGTFIDGYTYIPPPTVTSVTPTSGPDTGGTAVTITGANFVSGATVTFGGTAATGVTFVSATQIDVTTPAHVAGAVDVVVTNPDTQSGTLTNGYTYDAGIPDLQQVHYRWRNDDGGETGGFDTGTGADGAVTISITQNINTDLGGTVTTVTANPTGTSITVTSTTGFAANDEILLINLNGSSGDTADVGNYEFLDIDSVPDGTTINVKSTIQNSYDGTTFANQKIVVQRVPQWTTVTINSGGKLIANAWDGSSGGVVVFRATGSVTVNAGGEINADGLGYRGGTGGSTGGGINGESYDGTVGSGGNDTVSGGTGGNPGTDGGGGSTNYDGVSPEGTRGGGGGGGNSDGNTTSDGAGGGGGAGYGDGGGGGGGGADASGSGGAGGAGGTTTDMNAGGGGGTGGDDAGPGEELGSPGGAAGSAGGGGNGGAAGSGVTKTGQGGGGYLGGSALGGAGAGGGGGGGQYGIADLTTLFVGSGGAGGGGHDNGPVTGGTGGDGGGIIFVIADSFTVSGTITSNGAAGVAAATREGAGGGGSGGSILIQANSASLGTSLVTGTGGSGGAASAPGGGGGGGGIGRIRVEADTITGTTTPSASTGGTPGGSGSSATWAAAEDTVLTDLAKSTTKRLRIEISNAGGASGSVLYRLEVSDPNPASCDAATYTRVDTSTQWNMVTSTHFADGDPTVNIDPGLTDANTTFVAGQLKESTDETSGIVLSGTEFTEIEYAVQATASATNGATYCFRLTDAGTATSFTYTEIRYGRVTLAGGPIVTSVAPSSGPAAGGTAVTITGTDFVSGATVTFGGTAATGVTFVSSTQIDATTPAHAAGAVDVTVTNPDTVSGTFIDGYTYVPAPTVTSVAPTSGPDMGGTAITITGTDFVSGATVTFGGIAATGVTFVSSTQIDVTTPAHAVGAVDVVVTP
jgi:hypothetical protein